MAEIFSEKLFTFNRINPNIRMNKQQAIQSQIDEIMDEFDFRACCTILSALAKEGHTFPAEWVWHEREDGTIEFFEAGIRKDIRQFLKRAAHDNTSISTAYFTARYTEGVDEDTGEPFVRLSLQFGISSDNDGETYHE